MTIYSEAHLLELVQAPLLADGPRTLPKPLPKSGVIIAFGLSVFALIVGSVVLAQQTRPVAVGLGSATLFAGSVSLALPWFAWRERSRRADHYSFRVEEFERLAHTALDVAQSGGEQRREIFFRRAGDLPPDDRITPTKFDPLLGAVATVLRAINEYASALRRMGEYERASRASEIA